MSNGFELIEMRNSGMVKHCMVKQKGWFTRCVPMRVDELDSKYCSTKFKSHNLPSDTVVFVVVDDNDRPIVCGNKWTTLPIENEYICPMIVNQCDSYKMPSFMNSVTKEGIRDSRKYTFTMKISECTEKAQIPSSVTSTLRYQSHLADTFKQLYKE